jgi:hypothetical protein
MMKRVSFVVDFNFADNIVDVDLVAKNLANAIESHINHAETGIAGDEVNNTFTESFDVSAYGIIMESRSFGI